MAENKKSFIAYCDWGEIFDELEDDEAGRLAKHLFNYVRDLEPEAKDKLTKMVFIPIKQTLKRDLTKYDKYTAKQSANGKKGGRPKKPKETQITQRLKEEPKKTDSVNVIVNDNVSVIKETKAFNFRKSLLDYGFKKELVDDWMKVRKKRGATNTETAYKRFIKEIEKIGRNRNDLLSLCVERDWKGFNASWVKDEIPKNNIERIGSMNNSLDSKIEKMFEDE